MNTHDEFKLKHPEYYPSLKREGVYLLISIFLAIFSLCLDFSNYRIETSWFQRSGALLVILGVFCEGKYIAKIIQEDVVAMGNINLKQKLAIHTGFFIAVFGTLIWAYGDFVSGHAYLGFYTTQ